jgi:hypothetical protein
MRLAVFRSYKKAFVKVGGLSQAGASVPRGHGTHGVPLELAPGYREWSVTSQWHLRTPSDKVWLAVVGFGGECFW